MKIAVLGTGAVGRTIAAKMAELGHDVSMGTRDVEKSMARKEPGAHGSASLPDWINDNPRVKLTTFKDAAVAGEVIFNALSGGPTIAALRSADAATLNGKIIIDIANPLDFSKGFPPTLSVVNDDSLGEQIQREFPDVKVVKTLNTVNAALMVDPALLSGGDHTLFICGNDADAKTTVRNYLSDWFGWKDVIDLGDITNARGTEMLLALWIRLFSTLKTPMFNFKVVR